MFGYFASKRAAEKIVENSGLPWTTLRATQIHDLILMVAMQTAKIPMIPVPAGFRFQPVDTGEVAARLVELSLGKPSGLVPNIAGPRVYGAAELLRSYLRATKRRRLIVPLWLPGKAARAYRAGGNLAPERAVGHRSWKAFLADQVRRRPSMMETPSGLRKTPGRPRRRTPSRTWGRPQDRDDESPARPMRR
jgi:uncharacterized protein YbjT (DUF2867 family)